MPTEVSVCSVRTTDSNLSASLLLLGLGDKKSASNTTGRDHYDGYEVQRYDAYNLFDGDERCDADDQQMSRTRDHQRSSMR